MHHVHITAFLIVGLVGLTGCGSRVNATSSYLKPNADGVLTLFLPGRDNGYFTEADVWNVVSQIGDDYRDSFDVDAMGAALSDRCACQLAKRNLNVVKIDSTPVTDVGVSCLLNSPTIQSLDIIGCHQVTPLGLQNLKNAKNLKALHFNHLKGEVVVEALLSTPHLEELWAHKAFDDSDLQRIAKLPKLRVLAVPYGDVSDAGIDFICSIKTLRVLDISGNPLITDRGLKTIAESGLQLETLILDAPSLDTQIHPYANRISAPAINAVQSQINGIRIEVHR